MEWDGTERYAPWTSVGIEPESAVLAADALSTGLLAGASPTNNLTLFRKQEALSSFTLTS